MPVKASLKGKNNSLPFLPVSCLISFVHNSQVFSSQGSGGITLKACCTNSLSSTSILSSLNTISAQPLTSSTVARLPLTESQNSSSMRTSTFTSRSFAEQHVSSGARRVLFSQPAESDVDATIVYGVNQNCLNGSEKIISAASCSTNCVVPVIDVLENQFGVEGGVITTIHSAMNDQPVIDAYHHTDLRKTRAAMQSIIPVDTGLALGIDRLLPDLAGCFQAQAMRVPTVNVSAIDLSLILHGSVDVAAVNGALLKASSSSLEGILGYTEEPLASCDFNHDPRSGILD